MKKRIADMKTKNSLAVIDETEEGIRGDHLIMHRSQECADRGMTEYDDRGMAKYADR